MTVNQLSAVGLVFLGCCSNVVFLELIVSSVPSSGNIVTFAQFLFIAIEGFINASDFGRKKPVIPLSTYAFMVTMFMVVSVVNNYALNFNISIPLHIVFRSGSLLASMVLGVIILKKSYPWYKYISVFTIGIGLTLATLASYPGSNEKPQENESNDEVNQMNEDEEYAKWLIGISLLSFAMFMTARMGIYQETVYAKHGKHPSEALFYNHALPLPLFLFLAKDIYRHIIIFNNSDPLLLPVIGVGVPKLWLFLIGNILTQYVCIRGVFILTTECSSLTVTLVVTLRKFMSLLFSIVYFRNEFTFYHAVGTCLVFGGTLVFTEVFFKVKQLLFDKKMKQQ